MFIRKLKIIIFLAIGALMLAASLVYASSDSPERRPQNENEFKEDMNARRKQLYEGLGLTEGQKKLLEENRKKSRGREEVLFKEMRGKMEMIRRELQNETLNMEVIYRINNDLKQIQAQMLDDRLEGILEVRKILTPEQFKKFEDKVNERMEHFKNKREINKQEF